MVFIGFHVLDQDPMWKPTTQEELEDFGDKADKENMALKYVDLVRKRKGLINEREIADGEKSKGNVAH